MTEVLYTVARSDGEGREFNLSLYDAARAILHDDGCDYEIRPSSGGGYDLWSRQQVANIGWHRTQWFSLETDLEAAERDIFQRVVDDSGAGNWRGPIAEPQGNRRPYYITHEDEHGTHHQLVGAWLAETPEDAIKQMLEQAGEDDDGRWHAHLVESDRDIIR